MDLRKLLLILVGIVFILSSLLFIFWLFYAPALFHSAVPLIIKVALAICAGATLAQGIEYLLKILG